MVPTSHPLHSADSGSTVIEHLLFYTRDKLAQCYPQNPAHQPLLFPVIVKRLITRRFEQAKKAEANLKKTQTSDIIMDTFCSDDIQKNNKMSLSSVLRENSLR